MIAVPIQESQFQLIIYQFKAVHFYQITPAILFKQNHHPYNLIRILIQIHPLLPLTYNLNKMHHHLNNLNRINNRSQRKALLNYNFLQRHRKACNNNKLFKFKLQDYNILVDSNLIKDPINNLIIRNTILLNEIVNLIVRKMKILDKKNS